MRGTKLIVAASESCADLLYASNFRAPDDFAFIEHRGRKILLLSELEIDRARRTAAVDEVCALRDFAPSHKEGTASGKSDYATILAHFLASRKIRSASVPPYFPLELARALEKKGIRLHTATLCPEREFKSKCEVTHIAKACRIAEAGMMRAFEILRASLIKKHTSVRDARLSWADRTLTAEILRGEIEMAILRAGGQSRGDTIVACGDAACDPHERGTGALRAHELIVLDIFPRCTATGYFGDITRTVIRGHASDAQRQLWQLCLDGQREALRMIRPDTAGKKIQDAVLKKFADAGFPKEQHNGRWRGFFHGLGHGLGLEVHEAPRFTTTTLTAGQVVTVEPGIYWPGIGGVRHEDVVVITPTGHRLLTRMAKPFEI